MLGTEQDKSSKKQATRHATKTYACCKKKKHCNHEQLPNLIIQKMYKINNNKEIHTVTKIIFILNFLHLIDVVEFCH